MYDTVQGILPPYHDQFKLWECSNAVLKSNDLVPSVGMATTYSVRLKSDDPSAPARFLWVQENRITNLMAHQPIPNANVFDKHGGFLGRASEEPLQEEAPRPEEAVSIVEQLAAPEPEEAPPEPERGPPVQAEETPADDLKVRLGPATSPPMVRHDTAPSTSPPLLMLHDEKSTPVFHHELWLREDFQVELTLPRDLEEGEIERLKKWLDALPVT